MIVKGGENTKSKYLVIILTIIFILSVNVVSAADDLSQGIIGNAPDDILAADESTFTQLNNDIAAAGDSLTLDKNYTYQSGDDAFINGILINKPITITGNPSKNITISGNNLAKIFIINATVVLKNINFIDSKGAINVTSDANNCRIEDSYFFNNTNVDYRGGAINWAGDDGTIINSNFTNNTVDYQGYGEYGDDVQDRGGAIFWSGDNGNISNCNFLYNKAGYGAAISWGYHDDSGTYSVKPKKGFLYNSYFQNNNVIMRGGAIDSNCEELTVIKSNFTNNTAQHGGAIRLGGDAKNSVISQSIFENNRGLLINLSEDYSSPGAIEILSGDIKIDYCNFTNNTATQAGAIKVGSGCENVVVSSCNFINNSACYDGDGSYKMGLVFGGAIEWLGKDGKILNSNFTGNSAWATDNSICYAGAICWSGSEGNITDCNFFNNSATHYAGAISWEKNGGYGIISGSTFFNNSAYEDGAILWEGESGTVENCNFTSNSATAYDAGAVMWTGVSGNVSGSSFFNNSASNDAGAVKWYGVSGNVSGSSFFNNSASNGAGALNWEGGLGYLENCNFTSNYAYNDAGALKWEGGSGTVKNCNFTSNSAYDAGALKWEGGSGTVKNCNFTSNSAYDAGAVKWTGGSGNVSGSSFFNNSASNEAGALNWEGGSGTVKNCNFTSNSAYDAGAVKWNGEKGNVSGSSFFNNSADKDAGALKWDEGLGYLENCNFTSNSAYDAGAVKWYGGSGTVSGSSFFNNSADKDAGALKWEGVSGTVSGSSFFNNSASNDAGAVMWYGGSGTVSGSSFFNNSASNEAGALNWRGEFGTVENCNFTSNSATAYDAGAVKWNGKNGTLVGSKFTSNYASNDAGAVKWFGNSGNITGSTFDNNTAVGQAGALYLSNPDSHVDISNSKFIGNKVTGGDGSGGAIYAYCDSADIFDCIFENNTASLKAGAIYIYWWGGTISNCNFTNNNATKSGGAICISDTEATVSNSSFESNNAYEGGAICLDSDGYGVEMEITDGSRFDGNIAFRGSAIFIHEDSQLNISDAKFGKNRANSSNINIDVIDNVTYYPGNTTLIITFKGNDNIANAIWNDGDKNHVLINHITYEAFIDGNLFNKTITSKGGVFPISLSDVTDYYTQIWQDDLENAQLINVIISPIADSTLGAGLLGAPANQVGEPIYSSTHLTDVHGDVVIPFENLDVGKYQVYAEHLTDRYYTQKANTNNFEVIDALNVTKVSDNNWTDVGGVCDFFINITNNGDKTLGNITVIENIPSGFNQDYFNPRIWGYSTEHLIVDGNKVTYSGVLAPKQSLVIIVSLYAEKTGKYNNTIAVSSNLTNPLTVVSDEVTVYNPSINLTKTTVNSTVFIGNQAVFIINVTNTGDRPIMPDEWIVIDENYTKGLVYDHFENVTGNWYADGNLPVFILNSTLYVNESASFRIYFNTTKAGKFNNTALTIYKSALKATDNVSVVNIPTETVVGNVSGYPDDTVTIPVNVTSEDGIPFNGQVNVTLPNGDVEVVDIVNGSGTVPWTIPHDFKEGDYPVNASFAGNYTHLPSNGTGVVTVEKIPTHISVDNVTAHPGDDVVIPVNVTADDDVPFNGNITVILPDGSNQTVLIVNGTGNVNWTVPDDFEEGDYPVNASFEGDNKYLPSNGTGVVTVEKIPTHTTVSNVTAHPGDNVTIPVNVTADDGIPFNGNVTVTLPDGSNQTVEIINGTGNAYWTIPKENVSQYNDSASFEGDNKYLPSNGTGIISVILVDVQLNITVDKSVVYYGEIVEFIVTVRNNGPGDATNVTAVNIIPEGFVYISDNCSDVDYQNTKGLLMASVTTQSYDPSTGVWYIGDLANGEETKLSILAYANFIGTKQVNSSVSIAEFETDYTNNNDSVEVTAEKIPTEVSVENITTKPGKDITVPINVTAEDGVPINGNVTVELPDGTNKTVEITNGTGETTWTVPSDYAGDYNYTVSYDGNDTYLPSNNTGIITVTPKVPVKIIVGNITAKPGDNVSVPIDVIPEDGSVFNGNVTVILPDGTVKVVEIINGKGSVDWTIPGDYNGTYPVTVTFDGDDTYFPAVGTGFITAIPDAPVTPETPDNPPAVREVPMDNRATGNPLVVLLMVLALLGVGIKRKN